MRHFARQSLFLLAVLLLAGCAGVGAQSPPSLQVMVRFESPVAEPAAPALLQRLSRATDAEVRYLYPAGGGVHLYLVSGSRQAVQSAPAALTALPEIRYAQPDRRIYPLEPRAGD